MLFFLLYNINAVALAEKFYLAVEADLEDIADPELLGSAHNAELHIDQKVAAEEVYRALKRTNPDKCPGADEIPNRFL